MKEQLTELETSRLAKEKGFNAKTLNYYWDDGKLGIAGYMVNHNSNDKNISAPTKSLLQKWLREVYNIQLCLQPIYGGNKSDGKQVGWLCYTPFQDEDFNKLPSISLSQYTYGAALEQGLQQALKLIVK
jgi:hypothetical protein|tara:strand:+ start:2826 stop:3212 length:387 start_codon:yes stop_codon:yes gene_type:complete